MPKQNGLTLVVGATLSGSSMIAKLCAKNGAWIGDVEYEIPNDVQDYESYDHIRLAQLCRNAMGIEDRPDMQIDRDVIEDEFISFFDGLPTDTQPVVLKYQKAVHFLPYFRDKLGLKFKVVYACRNPFSRADSYWHKFGIKPFSIGIQEWELAYWNITDNAKGIPLYTVLYERFLTEPELEARQLFKFIGLSTKKVNLDAVDISKRHH